MLAWQNMRLHMRKDEKMAYLKANYHAHTYRCKHAHDTERDYIEAAIDMGLETFGFADHVPIPYHTGFVSGIRMDVGQIDDYVDTIRALAEEYKDQIRVLVGYEAEYVPDYFEEQMLLLDRKGYDFLIMGEHFLGSEEFVPYVGMPTEDEEMLINYVDTVLEGMRTGRYLYLAHPDLMHYIGPQKIYDRQMRRLCEGLLALNIPVEMNVLGMAGNRHYPTRRFWEIVGEVGTAGILGLDAHTASQVKEKRGYQRCMELADECGVRIVDRIF